MKRLGFLDFYQAGLSGKVEVDSIHLRMDLQEHFKAYVQDDTPAGYARALFMCAKMARDDLVARGYSVKTIHFVLLSALLRLFDEKGNDSRVIEAAAPLLSELQEEERQEPRRITH